MGQSRKGFSPGLAGGWCSSQAQAGRGRPCLHEVFVGGEVGGDPDAGGWVQVALQQLLQQVGAYSAGGGGQLGEVGGGDGGVMKSPSVKLGGLYYRQRCTPIPPSSPLWRSPITATRRMELQSLGGPGPTGRLPGATILPMLTPKQKIRARLVTVQHESGAAGDQSRRLLPCAAAAGSWPNPLPRRRPFPRSACGRDLRDAEEGPRGFKPRLRNPTTLRLFCHPCQAANGTCR